ncbi:hypothetical protein Btru_045171, partial [Bulinus truncatus]
MNYDTQQYAFSHGLATAPQLHVQQPQHHLQQHQLQQHQFQQQQHVFQPQYNHAIPTSNVYQFQFAGGSNQMFQQKDAHHMGLANSVQQRIGQHGMVSQPFIKQGMPLGGMEGIHVVNGLDGMIYSHPKNSLKIITNSDNRMMQQTDGAIGMQQTIVGVDMMGNSNFIDQSVDVQQPQNVAVASQGSMFTYNKQHFTGWLQPQNINTANNEQCQTVNQSSLPSFNHLWSQFQQQKQVGVVQHHQHLNQYQQPQQFHQQPLQPQQFHQQPLQPQQFTGTSFQTLPGIHMVKMQHQQQKPQQISVPVSMQSVQPLPSQFHSFSPSHINLMSSKCLEKDSEVANLTHDKGIRSSVFSAPSVSISQSISSPLLEHKCTTAVTYTISGPPKVTVTLDSLTHCETFPPNGLLEKSTEMSFNSDIVSANFVNKGKSLKISDNLTLDNCTANQRQWQPVQHQRNHYVPKPLFHTSSTGSSLERSSSESSNFSSPPYTFTPPSSTDSIISPVSTLFSKVSDFSSPKTMAITTSPLSAQYVTTATHLSNVPHNINSLVSSATMPALSVASTCTTTVTTTLASSYHSVALTTTSVTSTTSCSKESTGMASAHSGVILSSNTAIKSEQRTRSCSPAVDKALTKLGKEKKVKVPYSWQRKLENGIIEYLSPSGVVLQSLDQIYEYLLNDTTCKCGLECPLHVDKYFSFDPEVGSQPWCSSSTNGEDLGSLCNHRREINALAAFHNSQVEVAETSSDCSSLGKKRQDRKSVTTGDELIVSPLKRLKSSITKAVNKHAMFLGGASQLPTSQNQSVTESFLVGNTGVHISNSSGSTASPLVNQAIVGGGNTLDSFPSHSVLSSGFNTDQPLGESKQTFQMDHQKVVQTSLSQGFLDSRGGLYEPGNAGGAGPQTLISGRSVAKDKDKTQGEHHHSQMKSSNIYYQNQGYSNNSHHLIAQTSEGYLQSVWQENSPTRTPAISQAQNGQKRTYQSSSDFHHTSYIHPQAGNFPKHSAPHLQSTQLGGHTWLDPKKAKSKRPKSKKEKQKQINSIVDRSSPCAKPLPKTVKNAVLPSTAVSFFDNPTVFVEQQTAIINNSIASCQMSCSSPTPLCADTAKQIPSVSSCPEVSSSVKKSLFLKSSEEKDLEEKSDCDDQRSVIELDCSKSFSDTVENNDSAYLSQAGSDHERSDTTVHSDTCCDGKNRSCDVYDFTLSECKESQYTATSADTVILSETGETDEESPHFSVTQNKSPAASKSSEKKVSKVKPKVKPCQVKKEAAKPDIEVLKKNSVPIMNGDVTHLKTWSIPALQKVLSQCSSADTVQLNAAIQQAVSHAASAGLEFPASSLLSAAARAQLSLQNKEHLPTVSLPSPVCTSAIHMNKTEMTSTTCVAVINSAGGGKTAASSTPGSATTPTISQLQQHTHQPSACIQQLSGNTNLIGNVMQLQHLGSGNFTMNMLVPVCGQGQTFTSDSIHTATFASDHDHKGSIGGTGNINPLMAQGILATVSRSPELGSQLKLSVASVIPSSLGPHCTQDTMLLNNFAPARMIMNNPMPPVSVSVVTNVTKSLAQVVPTIGINQTVFNTQPVAQQLINPQQGGPQIINSTAGPAGTHMINTSPQGAQIVGSAAQGAQLVNNTSQATQIMNALSVQSLNNQLLITNPMQQVSPTNSISQLSPAMAAQIIAQGQQHMQQMSPSFLQSQMQKQTQSTVLSSQNMFASVSLPTLTVTSDHSDAIINSIAQSNIISNFQSNPRSDDQLDKSDLANISQVKDTVSMANPSLYASTSQPVFVIPQPNSNPVMQVLGTSQQLSSTANLPTDITQIFSQSAAIDHSQIQNLMNAGFNAINFQQMMGAVNLTGVQQQQQQLQMVQLQQLLLQQIQNQGQSIHGISLPLNQNSNPNQPTINAQTIMNTVVPQRSLHLNSVMDINALHSSLSPVAQGYQNQLSPATAQLQHLSPAALTVHQVTPVNTGGAVGVIHSTGVPGLMQASAKSLPSVVATVQSQQIAADQVIPINKTPTLAPSGIITQESSVTPVSVQTTITSTSKTLTVTVPGPKLVNTGKTSKSKSMKSKKSESKKVDPESERNEEDIAATVQQILAEAVQQQKELILAAKNQPPPPPKSKSKKSQMRAKSGSSNKEHDLGKLISISDESSFIKSEGVRVQEKLTFDPSVKCSESVDSYTPPLALSSQYQVSPAGTFSNHIKILTPSSHLITSQPAAPLPHLSSPQHSSTLLTCLNTASSFVEQTLNETTNVGNPSLVNSSAKKSGLSLKDHLSSIISRDKDGHKKKTIGGFSQKQGKGKIVLDPRMVTLQTVPIINGDAVAPQKTFRKSV